MPHSAAPAEHDSRYSWIRLGVTLAIAVVCNVGMWAVIVIMPAVQREFGLDRADASLGYTMTMLGFALGNLYIGRIVDRHGVTRAAVSKRCVELSRALNLKPSRAMRSISARQSYRRARLKHLSTQV